MKTYSEPLRQWAEYEPILNELPALKGIIEISGCSQSQKAHLMNGFSGLFSFHLIICEDEAHARELYEDYKNYDPHTYYYPAKDILFFQADIHGNLLIRQRMQGLKHLIEDGSATFVTTIDGCMDKLCPIGDIKKKVLPLRNEGNIDITALRGTLSHLGYECVAQVEMPGQFSVRGGIVDIYPVTEENPVRLELFGDEVDSLRTFDIETQRSLSSIEGIHIYPAAETIPEKEGVCFLDYFDPEKTIFFLDEPNRLNERGRAAAEDFKESRERRESLGESAPPASWVVDFSDIQKALNKSRCLSFSALEAKALAWRITKRYQISARTLASYNGSFALLLQDLKKYKDQKYRLVLLCGSRTRAERLAGELREEGLNAFFSQNMDTILNPGEILVAYGHARRGFEYPLLRFAVIPETDIFGQEQKKKRKKKQDGQRIQDFSELSVGDYVIHERYGIGIYQGIEKVDVDDVTKDYIKIQYLEGSNLYILATNLNLLQKYHMPEGTAAPALNRLGGKEWTKTRTKVRKAVQDIAKDLVALYAARQGKEGYIYGPDTVWQKEFEELFPYEETEDQLAAIEDTKRDMESHKIMDRLICGDVGYGKTEIALRAAFKAVQESRQVAYLVPTTILAQQHYNTFVQRMKDFPVRIELLSRFRTTSQQKNAIEGLKRGLVDIVIGTHRLLSKDVTYKNLGLLIIDEEQRFGVRHKEKIKQLKQDVDVLTLTATPIPRTLHMSLIGIRDMSLLEEPPMDRMPIQTYVMEYDEETVREAIMREMRRGGQVYYVYNRVNDIADLAYRLRQLVPEAHVEFAHGQMTERELEDVMYRFVDGDIDVLVTTTIIETGLDIQNANTMIIHDSDRYGLSQLYQLRGRIGRSNRTAYAFLMYKKDKMLREEAEKRLSAIREYTDLGSGFKIAMRDLEIRGAGDLLGAQQHGFINAVGYDLYCKMLSEAVREAKGVVTMEDFDTTIDISIDAYLPDAYIPNESQKFDIYRRIAAIQGEEDYDAMLEELIDRFGNPPKMVLNLLAVALVKANAHRAYISEIKQKPEEMRLVLFERARLDVSKIPELVKEAGHGCRFFAGKAPYLAFPLRELPKNKIEFLKDFIPLLQKLAVE